VEVAYLVEKGRLPDVVLRRLDEALAEPDAEVVVAPLTLEIAQAVRRIPRDLVSDMPEVTGHGFDRNWYCAMGCDRL
jgi:hypothetical protein